MLDEEGQNVERFLIDRIRCGEQEAWSDLIRCYQERLRAFALGQVQQHATAEDLVQETFVSFLSAIDSFRRECGLETFLFQILRRRIVDNYRAQGRRIDLGSCEYLGQEVDVVHRRGAGLDDSDPAAYWERIDSVLHTQKELTAAIRRVASQLCQRKKFRDLQVAEGTIYAGLTNQMVAKLLDCSPDEVAVVKHRIVAKLARDIAVHQSGSEAPQESLPLESIAIAWEHERPSCPKRTTIGKYVLGLLPDEWVQHVHFHCELLRCRICRVNLDELSSVAETTDQAFNERLMQSTVGFLRRQ